MRCGDLTELFIAHMKKHILFTKANVVGFAAKNAGHHAFPFLEYGAVKHFGPGKQLFAIIVRPRTDLAVSTVALFLLPRTRQYFVPLTELKRRLKQMTVSP